jgi:hypothetical protein
MPINPMIPLAGNRSRIPGIMQFAQARSDRKAQNAVVNEQNQSRIDIADKTFAADEEQRTIENDEARLNESIVSLSSLADGVLPALEAKDYDSVGRQLAQNKINLERRGVTDTRDTDEALGMFQRGEYDQMAEVLTNIRREGVNRGLVEDGAADFTLAPGSVRFNAQGEKVASVPKASAEGGSFESVFDKDGHVVAQRNTQTGKVISDPRAKKDPLVNFEAGSVGGKAATAGETELAKIDAKDFATRKQKAELAQQQRAQIDQIRAGAEGFRTGAFGETRKTVAQIVDFLGLDSGDFAPLIGGKASSAEAVNAAANTLTTKFVQEYDDRINKDELKLIQARGPTLFTTPEGIGVITDIMERQASKDVAIADFQSEWIAKSGGRFRVRPEEVQSLGLGAVSVDSALRKMQRGVNLEQFANVADKDTIATIAEPVITDELEERLSRTDAAEKQGLVKPQLVKEPLDIGGIQVFPPPEGAEPPALDNETRGSIWIGVTKDGKNVFSDKNGQFVLE